MAAQAAPVDTSDACADLSSVLFVVLTARATRHRARVAHGSWCAAADCLFVADGPLGESWAPAPRWAVLPRAITPHKSCCRGAGGFFCSPHRRRTLAAQYRFLPALQLARRSAAFASGRVRWVVLLDDDSFVFVAHLLGLLRQYNHTHPLLLGEFKPNGRYACGGGGAVLSRSALRRLDLGTCIASSRRRCMQSDWMLGECAERARLVRVERHGCGSCSTPNVSDAALAARLVGGCHFMQQAGRHVHVLLQSDRRSPSIVHGRTATNRTLSAELGESEAGRRGQCAAARTTTRHSNYTTRTSKLSSWLVGRPV